MTYFCTHDGRVLNSVVGPASPQRLGAEAAWAIELHERIARLPVEQQRAEVRAAHHARLVDPTAILRDEPARPRDPVNDYGVEEFEQHLNTSNRPIIASGDLMDPVSYALRTVQQRNDRKIHLLLGEFPLVQLGEIEMPIFTILAGQPFGRRTFNNDVIHAAIRENYRLKRPTLLFVKDQIQIRGEGKSPTLAEMLSQPDVAKLRTECGFFELTQKELTLLCDDLGQSPPPSYHGRRFAYVLLDAEGNKAQWRADGTTADQLVNLLHHAVAQEQEPETSEEELARREFLLAVNVADVNPQAALRRCRQIVARYGQTETARRAELLMARLE